MLAEDNCGWLTGCMLCQRMVHSLYVMWSAMAEDVGYSTKDARILRNFRQKVTGRLTGVFYYVI